MNTSSLPIVILISGRGSNLQSIIDQAQTGQLPIEIRAVISNEPDAFGLERARRAGIAAEVFEHRRFPTRDAYDAALMARIDRYAPELVVLAGFMRILGRAFVNHYAGRLMNIHPSLLPQFPGLHTHERAIESRVKQHGASVHFVTPDLDSGPLVIQAPIAVYPDDTPDVLADRVLEQEHRIYPQAIRWFAEGRLSVKGGRVLLDGEQRPEQGLVAARETALTN
ncbi:MAG: phosphoribosylglycinamide formyltransferase [Acidiferrobacterales bacterium]